MTFHISIRAIDGGWRVQGNTIQDGLLFFNDEAAESAASLLAALCRFWLASVHADSLYN